jgi:spore maturation protein CgeB
MTGRLPSECLAFAPLSKRSGVSYFAESGRTAAHIFRTAHCMKFVIFGLTISSSWGNGHATIWRGLCRALARRGHSIVFFERDVPYYAAHRDLVEWQDGKLCLFAEWNDVFSSAQRHLRDADVAMVTSYCPDAVVATECVLESNARMRVFYDLDSPVTLDSVQCGQSVAYLGPRGLRDFDLVLSYPGGRALDELRHQLGARRVAPLYGSVDPDAHQRVDSDPRFASDLSYLGTYAEDRQEALEELFIEAARRRPWHRFLIGGAQYPVNFPWAENIFFARHVEPPQHPAFYSSSRLTLNVTRRAMKLMGYCPSGRLFEAAACGTPILSDAWEGLDRFYQPGSEIILANDSDQVVAAMDLTDEALAQMAKRARERTLDEHTAEHRACYLEEVIAQTASAPGNGQPALAREPHEFVET